MAIDRLTPPGARGTLGPYTEDVVTNAAAAGAVGLDLTLGSLFNLTAVGNVVLSFLNLPAVGQAQSVFLVFRQDGVGGRTLTLPASVKWPGGGAPSISTAAGKVDLLTFTTIDAGATWWGAVAGIDVR